jgi:hypothetical protein
MQPESPLFDHNQFEFAIRQQEQRERISLSIAAVVNACRGGNVSEVVDRKAYTAAMDATDVGNERDAIPDVYEITESMVKLVGDDSHLRFAPTCHDTFTWKDIIPGESYFAIFEPPTEPKYDVLRLVNVPAGSAAAPDARGLYIARRRDDGLTTTFKLVDNPKYQQEVTVGSSIVDDEGNRRAQAVRTDSRRFIPQALTPEEAIAAADELEKAAQAYAQSS